MVKRILINFVWFLLGAGLMYVVLLFNKCNSDIYVPDISPKVDTIVQIVEVKIPKYKTVYVSRVDTMYKTVFDSIEKLSYINIPDSTTIALNQYIDSIKTENYKFEYEIMTLGDLIKFDPKFTIYQKPKINKVYPKWMVSGALSTRGHFKAGFGYKGWTVETELSDRVEQIYFGRQYTF